MKNTIINAKATQEKLELAKHFRQNMTKAETKLWKRLRANQKKRLLLINIFHSIFSRKGKSGNMPDCNNYNDRAFKYIIDVK